MSAHKDSQAQEVTGMEAPVPARGQVYWRVDTRLLHPQHLDEI